MLELQVNILFGGQVELDVKTGYSAVKEHIEMYFCHTSIIISMPDIKKLRENATKTIRSFT